MQNKTPVSRESTQKNVFMYGRQEPTTQKTMPVSGTERWNRSGSSGVEAMANIFRDPVLLLCRSCGKENEAERRKPNGDRDDGLVRMLLMPMLMPTWMWMWMPTRMRMTMLLLGSSCGFSHLLSATRTKKYQHGNNNGQQQ
ncbi:uncharacterized protein LOC117148889 [Drosophila mauritiana]|uniref:Uncharacterized protein LOC117148889 n=1 Tax=Drosophila mauritiana TaxID=7226 RepID=A0A6P8LA18_DROMA|nr:uncharacterized protein LOC117148889 [Drosophila mauritiana]